MQGLSEDLTYLFCASPEPTDNWACRKESRVASLLDDLTDLQYHYAILLRQLNRLADGLEIARLGNSLSGLRYASTHNNRINRG